MLRPVLLVGVGGSGGKTLRAMRQSLLRKLRQVGWDSDQLPDGWQMMWVDSVSQQDEDKFPAPLLPNTQYVGLVTPGLAYADLRTALENSVKMQERQSALAGWVPENVPIAVSTGAGQARAIGRAISAAQIAPLKSALQAANDRLTGVDVISDLSRIANLFGQSDDNPLTEPMAIVVSSVAGGSGSGMFQDVIETLKTVNPAFAEPGGIITVLYTPDVFASIEGAGTQIPPNTLAAVMETTAGVLAPGLSDASVGLLESRGLVKRSRHGFGSKCNFLVGASNKNVSLGSQEDVYYAVGESLTSIVTDDKVQQSLRAFTLTNIFLMAGSPLIVEDASGLTEPSDSDESMPFSGLGMSRLNLGTDRLSEYISMLVGRDIVEALLWPDFEPRQQVDGVVKTPEELIDERVGSRWKNFLEASGLNERDPANDIVDALIDKESAENLLVTWSKEGLNKASQGLDDKGLSASEWTSRLQNYYDNNIATIRAQQKSDVYEHLQAWTTTIQDRLVELTTEYSLAAGLTPTTRLLEKLIDEMSFVVDELKGQVSTKRSYVPLMGSSIQQALNVGANRLPADEPAVQKAVKIIREGARLQLDADRFELAAETVEDLTEHFLRPMLQSAQFSRARLLESVTAERLPDNRPNPWPTLPEFGKPVPSQLRPGATERVLIAPEDYEDVLRTEVQALLSLDEDRKAWRKLLRERAALGQVLDSGKTESDGLFRLTTSWVPSDPQASKTRGSGESAIFASPQTFIDVQESVSEWLLDVNTGSGLANFLKQGLNQYVESGSPEVQVKRQQDLIAGLQEVVSIAAPFVDINAAVRAALHPNVTDSFEAIVSTIPFIEGDPLHERVKSVLQAGGLWSDKQSPQWFATGKVSEISVFTMSGRAMMPMVFDNVMKPIAMSWASNQSKAALRHSFWSMRRARPLIEVIPAGHRQISAMVRGWFLSGLLGQRTKKDEPTLGPRVQIWDPESRSMVDFPFPLLSTGEISSNSLIAAVLKSLGIAMVEVNSQGNLRPLRAYQRLSEIGSFAEYQQILSEWIKSGTTGDASAPIPEAKIAGDAAGSLDERREAVLKILTKTKTTMKGEFDDVTELRNPYQTSNGWEIREYIYAALDDLIRTAESIRDDEETLA